MNGASLLHMDIHFDPLVPPHWLITGIILATLLCIVSWRGAWKNALLRLCCALLISVTLLNPSILQKERVRLKDIAIVIVDKSASQSYGQRAQRTAQSLATLQKNLSKNSNIELRVVDAPSAEKDRNRTNLFATLDETLADIPADRRAGVIMLTDGQVQDVPQTLPANNIYGPVDVFLSGDRDEKDRQLLITQNPAYGIVGKPVQIKYKIVDTQNIHQDTARLSVRIGSHAIEYFTVPVGQEQTYDMPVDHAGKNSIVLDVEPVPGEITTNNNHALTLINGIRDRMRVLLVTGQPYAGGRTWRDLLKSDPNIDLVQFTILREPEKIDATPQNEMALIEFPFRELFEVKLREFDLVIFDRYKLNRILPDSYFSNIESYVRDGGAFLEINGPSYATSDSLYYTALMNILPGKPTGEIINMPYTPSLTDEGKIHPVTRDLQSGDQAWGRWLRQVGLDVKAGDVLLTGAKNNPLLILNRVDKGRIAQLASDQTWLWSHNYDGGGPYTELLRRVIHWLMKEPELDETLLDIKTEGRQINVTNPNPSKIPDVQMTGPNGQTQIISFTKSADGGYVVALQNLADGVYTFINAGGQEQYAFVGDPNAAEFKNILSTGDIAEPFVKMSGGGLIWMEDNPNPEIKFYKNLSVNNLEKNHFNLRNNDNYEIKNLKEISFLPVWLSFACLIAFTIFTWWHEGRD